MWQEYQILDKYNREFKESIINNPSIIDSNTDYTVMMVYGKSGSSKSTCINLYMRNDILQTGINDDGISKGIYLCKRNDLIILDTEGVGTDNRGSERYDIVTIFCISSCFVIIQPIMNRFPESDIVQIIEEILLVFERIVKINPSNQNKPSFLILLPIFNPVSPERFQTYKVKANEFINGELFNKVRNYFGRVSARVLPPLDERARNIMADKEKISFNEVSTEHLREIDNAFEVAIQSSNKKKGSNFKSLNILLSLSRENKLFDPLIIERANNTLLPLINREFSNAKKYYSNKNNFESFVGQCKENIINEINGLGLSDSDETCFLKILVKEFKSREEIEITNFNNYILEYLARVADNECKEITSKIKGSCPYEHSNLLSSIHLSRKKIEECEIFPTSDFQFINSFRIKKDQQLSKLNTNNFDEKFIEFRILKPFCAIFVNSNASSLRVTKTINSSNEIKSLENKYKSELEEKIKDYQRENNSKLSYTLSSTDESLVKKLTLSFFNDISKYYNETYKPEHDKALKIIEEQRILFSSQVIEIMNRAGTWGATTIDDFHNASKSFETNLSKSLRDLFTVYSDEILNCTIGYFDCISSSAVKTCITFADSFICPGCGNLWEKRIESSLGSYIGCGNFYCHGKTIGCNGRQFRTEMKEANKNNNVANSISPVEIIQRYPLEIQNIANGAKSYLMNRRK